MSDPLQNVDVMIFDGFFLLHSILDVPSTFERLGILIMKTLCGSEAGRIDIVFDRFVSPSIKD